MSVCGVVPVDATVPVFPSTVHTPALEGPRLYRQPKVEVGRQNLGFVERMFIVGVFD